MILSSFCSWASQKQDLEVKFKLRCIIKIEMIAYIKSCCLPLSDENANVAAKDSKFKIQSSDKNLDF